MKNLLKILWIAPLLLIFNCGDDDDDSNNVTPPQADNVLIVGDVSYDLEWGSLLNFGEFEPGIINIDLELWSTGLIVPESGCDPEEGEGQGLYFEMFTSNETSLDDGTYTYNMDPALTTWDYGDYNLNLDSNANNNEDLWVELESGTVSIEKTGSNYNISWDLVDVNNVSITGIYSGSLNYCDEDGGNLQPNGSSKRSNN
jgi:hypothetical protein